MRRALAFLCILAIGLALACAPPAPSSMAVGKVAVEIAPRATPLRVALFLDKSGSASWTRVPSVTPDHMHAIAQIVSVAGGELALGLIADRSNRGLCRLTIPSPPNAPSERAYSRNAFFASREKRAFRDARRVFEGEYAEWQTQGGAALGAFIDDVAPLLEAPTNAPRTDVWGAVQRAELFLSEDEARWGEQTRRYLILVTDGIETARSSTPCRPLGKPAEVVVVNGSASVGALGCLRPRRFESFEAVVSWMATLNGAR